MTRSSRAMSMILAGWALARSSSPGATITTCVSDPNFTHTVRPESGLTPIWRDSTLNSVTVPRTGFGGADCARARNAQGSSTARRLFTAGGPRTAHHRSPTHFGSVHGAGKRERLVTIRHVQRERHFLAIDRAGGGKRADVLGLESSGEFGAVLLYLQGALH